MKFTYTRYLLTLCFVLFSSLLSAQSTDSFCEFMDLDSEELLKLGKEYEKRESMDSALVLYSIVSKRNYNTDNEEDIKKCCEAYINKALIYFSYFFDYTNAYENIISAMDLKNEARIDYSFVDNTAAIFYHVIAVTCRDWNLERMAMNFCNTAYNSALKDGDRKNMNVIVSNMIVMSCNLNDSKLLDEVWKTYKNNKDDSFYYKFNNIFYRYLKFLISKHYDKAAEEAEKMLLLSENTTNERHVIISYNSIVEAYDKNGDYKTALLYIEKEEKLVEEWNMRDIAIELLKTKENIYRKIGENTLADDCLRMYYQKKDSLLNLTEMTNICRTQYNGESRKMEKEIERVTIENKIYNNVVIIILAFVVVLVVMVIMLRIKIKQLKKCNITIYENNEENIKHEDKERQKLKDEVLKLENVSTGISSVPDFTVEKTEIIEDDKNNDEEKYKNTSISDDEKKKLLDKILTVMEDVDEICSESFSGARLAELTGYKYNYVSLVINENYGCNFNSLLNKFRIKEACRRLADDEHYGKYTIDSISNSLGFKSRTTLVTSFKKIVGLTPSQYRAIAKEKGNN